jgi:hypothetical protein
VIDDLSHLSVLILDTTLALVVDERSTSRALASVATEHRNLAIGSAIAIDYGRPSLLSAAAATGTTAEEQEDGCKEHGCPGTPGEAKSVTTNASILSIGTEIIACLNEGCTQAMSV